LTRLLEGKPIADKIREGLKTDIAGLRIKPLLASLVVGNDPATQSYIKSQIKAAQELGIEYQLHKLASNSTQADILGLLKQLNNDKSVHGIIIQDPLPKHLNYKEAVNFIDPKKDVEGVHPDNLGRIILGEPKIIPCTAYAVMEMILQAQVDLCGKEIVIVGHSQIVGKPLALLLVDKLATVTICHIGTSKAGRLQEHIKRADILIVAVGSPNLIKGEWIKEGGIVIDVGINCVGDRIVGDVEFEGAKARAGYITPVPGGVGPLTVVMLMRNLVEAVKIQ